MHRQRQVAQPGGWGVDGTRAVGNIDVARPPVIEAAASYQPNALEAHAQPHRLVLEQFDRLRVVIIPNTSVRSVVPPNGRRDLLEAIVRDEGAKCTA